MAIRIAITDDHVMLVNGLRHALEGYKNIEVTGTYSTGGDLLTALEKKQPDVLLLDLQLPDYMGNELAAKIRLLYPEIRILILTGMESAFHVQDVMQQGCMGYLFKTSTTSELLISAIEKAYANEVFIDPAVKELLVNDIIRKKTTSDAHIQLSKRETEILKLIASELSSPEIASKLFISHRTVENHRFSLMQKLGVKNVAGLVLKAVQLGLTESK
jgi:DNA-binding NarL/FixJ family response regulator